MDLDAVFYSPFFVGATGALVSLCFSSDDRPRQRLTNLMCGMLISGYTSRGLVHWLKLSDQSDLLGVAFVVGMLGKSVAAAVFEAARHIELAQIIKSWITRR